MLKKLLFVGIFVVFLFFCNFESVLVEEVVIEIIEVEVFVELQIFGEVIIVDGAIFYQDLSSKMEIEVVDFVVVKFIGMVQEVCQAKGCWMMIVLDDLDVEFIMVCFKDYGFFMFKDIVGCKVIMDGYVFVEEILVDELCYYVEDVGKLQEEIEAIIEFKKEMKFLVSGVLLLEE